MSEGAPAEADAQIRMFLVAGHLLWGCSWWRGRPRGGTGRGRVHRPDPGDDLPQIVVRFYDTAHLRHRPDHGLRSDAAIALLLQLVTSERDQAEQRVVVLAIDPDLVGQGRSHAAAASTAVAPVAPGGREFLMAFLGDAREVGIGLFSEPFAALFAVSRAVSLGG